MEDKFLSAPLAAVAAREARALPPVDHSGELTVHHLVHRLREVHARPAGKRTAIEERKLISHSVLITVSVILTVACTGGIFVFFHLGLTVPIFPSYLQEIWDWVWGQ